MSDPARSIAHRFCETECDNFDDSDVSEHGVVCDRLTAAIEADRAASDAREDRLREALEPVAISTREPNRCGVCHWLLADCADAHCRGYVAREALAAIPPRSDR